MDLIWETVKSELMEQGFFAASPPLIRRAKVPGGWFVQVSAGVGITPRRQRSCLGSRYLLRGLFGFFGT